MRVDADGLKENERKPIRHQNITQALSTNEDKGRPLFRFSLETQLDKGVKVWRERPVVGVSRRGGGGLSVGVANAPGARALADPGVGTGAGGFQREFLRWDGGGVQQTRNCSIQLLQQHLRKQNGRRCWM